LVRARGERDSEIGAGDKSLSRCSLKRSVDFEVAGVGDMWLKLAPKAPDRFEFHGRGTDHKI